MKRRTPQHGDVMLFCLFIMLLLALGFFGAMRTTLQDTQMTGNNLARQKSMQVLDIAMRKMEVAIDAAANGQALEMLNPTPKWFRNVPPGTRGPSIDNGVAGANYWLTCLPGANGGDLTKQCDTISLGSQADGVNGQKFNALVVVQPTFNTDKGGCTQSNSVAIYYDVYLFAWEGGNEQPSSSGLANVSSSSAEAIFKLCIFNGDSNAP